MPFPHNLTTAALTKRVMNAVAAGSSATSSTGVDMLGYTGIRFIGAFGALTGTQVTNLRIQESNDDGSVDPYASVAATLTANMADGDSNKLLITDLYKPLKRYCRALVTRGTANAVIDSVVAELYRAQYEAVTADTTVSAQVVATNG